MSKQRHYYHPHYPGTRISTREVRELTVRLAAEQNWRCCYRGCKLDAPFSYSLTNFPISGGGVPLYTRREEGFKLPTLEHIVPRRDQGPTSWENCAAACSRCNNERGSMPVERFLAQIEEEKGHRRQAEEFSRLINRTERVR